jgi:hypothetical protein
MGKQNQQLSQTTVSGSALGFIIIDEKGKPLLKDSQLPIYWLKKIALEDSKKFIGSTVKKVSVYW